MRIFCLTVYVFMGTAPSLIEMMTNMQALQLFDNGEYMVIYIDMETYSVREAVKYLWSKYSHEFSFQFPFLFVPQINMN